MLQTIITAIIVLSAAGITVSKLITYFTNPLRGCNGCSEGCGSCSLQDLKKEIEKKRDQH
jgi:hypothetical protein